MLNIGGDQNDSSYRYKMPKLVTKVEGRGNGIKTVIVNMVDVSKALHIAPQYTTKFFGHELGAQSRFNAETERSVVNGKHDSGDLQKILKSFIDVFVLCPGCGLPEIKMIVKKDIKIDCAACGHNGELKSTHKLVPFIIKEYKERKKAKAAEKDKNKEKKEKKDKKDKKSKGEDGAEEKEDPEEGAEEIEVIKKEKEEDLVWHTDTSKEAIEARKMVEFNEMNNSQEASRQTIAAIIDQAGQDQLDNPVVVLKLFLATEERDTQAIVSEIRRLQLARGLDDAQKVKVLLDGIIDYTDLKTVPAQFLAWGDVFKQYTKEKKGSLILIQCIEELCGVTQAKLLVRVPLILQNLYEADVLEEEVLLQWHASPPEASWLSNKEVATQVRRYATPFIDWLKNADEGDSDEE